MTFRPSTGSYWRDRARVVVEKVLAATKDVTPPERRRALIAAYPFGERNYHPYKVWLDEIKRQTGEKPPLGTRTVELDRERAETADPRQGRLF